MCAGAGSRDAADRALRHSQRHARRRARRDARPCSCAMRRARRCCSCRAAAARERGCWASRGLLALVRAARLLHGAVHGGQARDPPRGRRRGRGRDRPGEQRDRGCDLVRRLAGPALAGASSRCSARRTCSTSMPRRTRSRSYWWPASSRRRRGTRRRHAARRPGRHQVPPRRSAARAVAGTVIVLNFFAACLSATLPFYAYDGLLRRLEGGRALLHRHGRGRAGRAASAPCGGQAPPAAQARRAAIVAMTLPLWLLPLDLPPRA